MEEAVKASLQISDYVSLAAIVISFVSLFIVFKDGVHNRRQRALLISVEAREFMPRWGDARDMVTCRIVIDFDNRSSENYALTRLRLKGVFAESLCQGTHVELTPIKPGKEFELQYSAPPKSNYRWDFFLTFRREPKGGSVDISASLLAELEKPLRFFDFLNLSSRRWCKASTMLKYKAATEIVNAANGNTSNSQSDI